MRILIVGDISPGPVRAGNQELNVRVIKLLESMGHKVTYLYVYQKALKKKVIKEKPVFKELGIKAELLEYEVPYLINLKIKIKRNVDLIFRNGFCRGDSYYPCGLTNFVRQLNHKKPFDACIVNYFYLSKLLSKTPEIPHRGFMTHDSFINRNIINGVAVPSLKPSEEAKILQRIPNIFSLQDIDSAVFHRLAPKSKIFTVYMPITYRPSSFVGNHNILFFSGDSVFNHNGLNWFITKVLPKVRMRYNDVKLIIGGGICKSLKNSDYIDQIELYGFVEDEKAFFNLGDIAINPVYQGSGLKIKTLQSLANDKITVATPHSAEGLYTMKSNSLITSSNEEEWVEIISKLWNDSRLILDYKQRNNDYFQSYNKYIENQYRDFLNT